MKGPWKVQIIGPLFKITPVRTKGQTVKHLPAGDAEAAPEPLEASGGMVKDIDYAMGWLESEEK